VDLARAYIRGVRALRFGLLIGCMIAMGGCTGGSKPAPVPPPAGGSGVKMKLTTSKPEFQPSEAVVLKVELTNVQSTKCAIIRVPEGGFTVLSATRDGSTLVPGLSTGDYIDGMSSFLRANVAQLAPNGSLNYELTSQASGVVNDRPALEVSTLDSSDQANLLFWPLDQPGKYELSARYVPPPLDEAGALCRASADPVTVSFTVLGG
jgi:hypothetical protein